MGNRDRGDKAPWTPEELRRIVAEFQAGLRPDEAFRKIAEGLRPRLLKFLKTWGSRPDDVEDLAQKVLMDVHKGLPSYRGDAAFETWVGGIAKNVLYSELRERSARKRQHQRVPLDEVADLPRRETSLQDSEADSALDLVLRKEQIEGVLERARRELPRATLHCFLLRFVQGRDYHEIATVLKIKTDGVRWHIHEAKKRLTKK